MGQQIAVALTKVDEAAFLEFLHSKADIKPIESFAPSEKKLWTGLTTSGINDSRGRLHMVKSEETFITGNASGGTMLPISVQHQ